MFLQNPFPQAFGLEIGDLSLKLVQLHGTPWRRKNGFGIKEIREVKLPAGLIVNGEIQQPELVRKKLLHILGKDENKYAPIKSPWVVASLPEVKTFIKLIKIETSPDDVSDADVLFQTKKHLPFDEEDEVYISWQIVNKKQSNDYAQVLIAAVPKIIGDSYTYLLESVQLIPLALEIEALSIARSLITNDKNYVGEARAILDLGATRSSLIIYDNNTIQFSTSLNFSGELINTAIQQAMKIDHQQAEEMKINNGVKFHKKNTTYLKSISKTNNQLISELTSALQFYNSHFKNNNPINHITMCGGMSLWNGLDNFISSKLKISSHPGNVWKNLENKKIVRDRKGGLTLAVAMGLALRAIQRPFVI